jgi:membrane peptidoglycan carboxypeptidase
MSERRDVLDMLVQGKITADEAERLLLALDKTQTREAQPEGAKPKPKFMRVLVDDGKNKVNAKVPLQLLRAGVKLASVIPPLAQAHLDEALREKGVTINLAGLKPENLEEVVEGLSDMTVDVDDDKAKVRVFCE